MYERSDIGCSVCRPIRVSFAYPSPWWTSVEVASWINLPDFSERKLRSFSLRCCSDITDPISDITDPRSLVRQTEGPSQHIADRRRVAGCAADEFRLITSYPVYLDCCLLRVTTKKFIAVCGFNIPCLGDVLCYFI